MSKPRLHVSMTFDTRAHADTVKLAFTARLTGKNIFSEDSFFIDSDEDGSPLMVGQWRFGSIPDRDDVRDFALVQARDDLVARLWILAAKVSWHLCTHDDRSPVSCRSSSYEEYVK